LDRIDYQTAQLSIHSPPAPASICHGEFEFVGADRFDDGMTSYTLLAPVSLLLGREGLETAQGDLERKTVEVST
jgi:hypothetical protein